jgi:hypothetical protein
MGDCAHMAAMRVGVPAAAAFAFLSDGLRLGRWALGCFDTAAADGPGLFVGTSLFDGAAVWVGVEADPGRLVVDYLVGRPEALRRRISARVVPGDDLGLGAGMCLVTLTAWRPAEMADDRWAQLRACHEAEILLIAAQMERAGAERAPVA